MYRIGLAGGMGSGKSEVAALLEEHGALVVEADAVARDMVAAGTDVLGELVGAFGDGILRDDGSLDRRALAEAAFASERTVAVLNAITHPPLVGELVRRAEELERENPDGLLVIAAALLVQWDVLDLFDTVLVVEAPVETRVERLVAGGFSEADARGRIASQLSDEEMSSAADEVITNDGSLEELRAAVDAFWRSLPIHEGEDQE